MSASRAAVYGFETKCHPDQQLEAACLRMTPAEYVTALKRLGVGRFIVLRRRNYLRQLVSFEMGWRRGRWHVPAEETLEPQAVAIDVACCGVGGVKRPVVALFEQMDRVYRDTDNALGDQPTLRLWYEDHVEAHPREAYLRIAAYLGLTPIDPKPRYARTNPGSLSQVVTNHAEVEDALRGTPYAWMAME
ncbi:MAG: hypothetical protein AAF823_02170 [Planctomycetota bacterium]